MWKGFWLWIRERVAHKGAAISAALFLLLIVGLVLGDGKQGLIEVYGAIAVLSLWSFRIFLIRAPLRPLPRPLAISWMAIALSSLVSSSGSLDMGYSISWGIRLLSGYALFRMFFDLSAPGVWAVFFAGLPVLAGIAIIFSLAWNIPWVKQIIPAMSLVGMSYGHNHLIDIIMLASPILLWRILKLPRKTMSVLLTFFWIAVTLTRARAAWIILSAYTIVSAVFTAPRRNRAGIVAAVFAVTIVSATLGLYFLHARPSSLNVRLGYWRQALEGFQDRPLFGNGPGTFFLVSLRHQRIDENTSWFVHNHVLETLTEQGVVGAAAFLLLGYFIILEWRRFVSREKPNERLVLLGAGVLLVFIYGTVEYVLSYLVIWLLCWSILGLICGMIFPRDEKKSAHHPWETLFILFLFYLLWVLGNGLGLFIKRHDISFKLAPFDAPLALLYVSDPPGYKQKNLLHLAYAFHRGNPAILAELGMYYWKFEDQKIAIRYLREAAYINPLNMATVADYLRYLAKDNPDQAGREMVSLLSRVVQDRFRLQVMTLHPFSSDIGRIIRSADEEDELILQEGYVSLLYDIGLFALPNKPALTKAAWTLARDIFPDFGPTHVELARYYLHVEHSETKARETLRTCLGYPSAETLCRQFYETELTEFDLLPPGDYRDILR